jgi:hypothetical protein
MVEVEVSFNEINQRYVVRCCGEKTRSMECETLEEALDVVALWQKTPDPTSETCCKRDSQ